VEVDFLFTVCEDVLLNFLVVSSSETSSLKASISVNEKKDAKNASIGPNNLAKSITISQKCLLSLQLLLNLAQKNMVVTAGAKHVWAGLPVLLQQLVAFYLPQTTL